MPVLEELNSEQRRAVEADDGSLMVVAGPGTGKTKTLTERIVYLVESGRVKPEQILALTFTKKAAEEMRSRVAPAQGQQPKITTFHALCHELLGSDMPFVADAHRLQIIKSLPRPKYFKGLSVRELGLIISRAKNMPNIDDPDIGKIVRAYNQALADSNVRDFDDLLLDTYKRLQSDENVRTDVHKHYRYVLVDEFQDTNLLQYEILKLLLGHGNIFAIGDPNQSIYGFRGASGTIFAEFERDFPKVKKVTLRVNYRSARRIVKLSNYVFKNSEPLTAHTESDGQMQTVQVLNEYSEANWVLEQIQKAIGGGDFMRAVSDDERKSHQTLRDFAILYRSRSAAVAIQKAISESGLPYQIVGDGSPYDKPEIQSVIMLLRSMATSEDVELKNITKTQTRTLLAGLDKTLPPSQLVDTIAAKFGFEQTHELTGLTNTLVRFDDMQAAVHYLDDIAQQQFYDPRADVVTLLTIHAAKGLEFPHVFLIAAEEGILPHVKADKAEEQRLFYVAATRARERLDILHAQTRSAKPAKPSRFIAELPETILPKTIDVNLATDQRRAQKRKLKRSQQTLF